MGAGGVDVCKNVVSRVLTPPPPSSLLQVAQSVDITWVQPRILDKAQLGVMAAQLDGWAVKVKDATLMTEEQTAELLC